MKPAPMPWIGWGEGFPPEMTVRGYLSYAARMKGVGRREAGDAVEQVLAQIDLKHMAERAKTHIKKTQRRLENLRNVTSAQEEHVKETFGMDIGEFRKN